MDYTDGQAPRDAVNESSPRPLSPMLLLFLSWSMQGAAKKHFPGVAVLVLQTRNGLAAFAMKRY